MTDVFIADPAIADIQVRSPSLLYIFGKGPGETSLYATDKAGAVVYSANVRVGNNFDQVRTMLRTAMPGEAIDVTALNGMTILTGTVHAPEDVEEAQRLVQAIVGDKVTVVNRLKTATPMQVSLHVKIAEVSRDLMKEIGVNLLAANNSGSFRFGMGRDFLNDSGQLLIRELGSTSFWSDRLLGLNFAAALDLLEQDGVVTTLAQPSLTALSGETASFLAGGEFPIPIQQSLGTTTIEYKQYGVGLAFTPTVLNDSSISMRRPPAVPELSRPGSVRFGGLTSPAQPHGPFGRNGELPCGRRVSDPDPAEPRHHNHRVQAIWCRPGLHAHRAQRQPHLDARPPGGVGAERCGFGELWRLHHSGPGDAPG